MVIVSGLTHFYDIALHRCVFVGTSICVFANVEYTAAPTNMSAFHGWSTGPIFYSSIFLAEALGKTNTSQVKDILPNEGNDLTPGYVIYENGKFARMALINYMTDPSGANDYTATVYVGGDGFGEANGAPASIKVKYLSAPSTSEKDNITWAGQVSPIAPLLPPGR